MFSWLSRMGAKIVAVVNDLTSFQLTMTAVRLMLWVLYLRVCL